MKQILSETRKDLAKLLNGVGAEIGVERGIFAEEICKGKTKIKLFCVDLYKPYKEYRDHQSPSKLEKFFWRARKRMYHYDCIFIRKTSMDAVEDFEDNSLDFVYIDANHSYKHAKQDIEEWAKKVKPGGIISGHDYKDLPERGSFYRVMKAVDEYVAENKIDILYIFGGDEIPSWMFYKK